MLDPVFKALDGWVTDPSWRRLAVYLSFAFVVLLTFGGYELYTHSFELTKLERMSDLLEKLEAMQNSNPEILQAASNIRVRLVELSTSSEPSRALVQAAAATAPWIIFSIIFVVGAIKDKEEDWADGLIGGLVLAFFAGAIGYGVDTAASNWMRFGTPQIANAIMFALFYFIGSRMDDEHSKPNNNAPSAPDAVNRASF